MSTLETIYLQIFRSLYPFIHSHFVSYCLLVVFSSITIWLIWRFIVHFNRYNQSIATFTKYILIFIELFLVGFLLWFIFIHFHTFLLRMD